ncbi:IPT/TIG domain-containing protein [Spongisporangium articulatum]|uniref:IPT/TIG domain-containing protein n=1 Tax=Spongisporangium articulatum TaxID=3362603 RepID=A0ABW8ASD7_9ACTN
MSLPRTKRAIAYTFSALFTLGTFSLVAGPAEAITGTVESTAQALDTTIVGLGITTSMVTTNNGPQTGSVAAVNSPGLLGTSAVHATVDADNLADTAHATAGADDLGLTLLNTSILTVGAVDAVCDTTGGAATATTTLTNASGIVTLPTNPAPNTVIPVQLPVGLLGANVTVANLHLNEQPGASLASTPGGLNTTSTTALRIELLHVTVGGITLLNAGNIPVGKVGCASTKPATPVASALSPTSGPTAGGTTVTVDGSNMLGVTGVTFGGVAGTNLTRVSTTRIRIDAPAHASGAVSVAVTNATGTGTAAQQYTYRAVPTVTSVSPAAGPLVGGTQVTVTGTGFAAVSDVKFGATSALAFTVNSPTRITATTPAHVAGDVHTTVTGTGGTSATSGADLFSYLTAPTLTSVSPTSGSTQGGDPLTLTGTEFTPGAAVTVGGVQVTPTFVNGTTLQVTSPAHAAGTANVVVTTAGGPTAPGTFTYVVHPAVTSYTPHFGYTTGGDVVTVHGTGLNTVTSVTVGGLTRALLAQSATSLTFDTPALGIGPQPVVLVGPGTVETPVGDFDYYALVGPLVAPTVTNLSPTHGVVGDTVTITGTDFSNTSTVTFGSTPATGVVPVDDQHLTVVAPPGTGVVDVTVDNGVGVSTPDAASDFTYDPPSPSPTTSPPSSPSPTSTAGPSMTTSPTGGTGTGGDGGTGVDGSPDPVTDGGTDGGTGAGTGSTGGNTSSTGGSAGSGATGGGITASSRGIHDGPAGRGTSRATAVATATPKVTPSDQAGGVTDDALTSALTGRGTRWIGLLAALAALGAALWLGDGWWRQWRARRLADRLIRGWTGAGPLVASEAVAVLKVPALGENWRWPVYPVAADAASGDRGFTRGVGLQAGHLDEAGHWTATGDLTLAARAADRYDPLLGLNRVAPGDEVHVITPHRTLTYQVSRTAAFGSYIAGWSPVAGPPPEPGSSLLLGTTDAGDDGALAPHPATVKAALARVAPTTADARAAEEADTPAP